jgi:hypothetical protein
MDDDNTTGDSASAAKPKPLDRRADGKWYCCDTLGWVDEATLLDHRWDTSRPYDEYVSERASAWDGIEPGK